MAMASEGTRMVKVVAATVTLWMVTLALTRALAADYVLKSEGDDKHYTSCIYEGRRGWCVNDNECHANHTLSFGGQPSLFDIRDNSQPVTECEGSLWCCSNFTTKTPSSDRSCTRSFDTCPWCVALYREGGDASRGHRTANGLYCAGSLVSPRVVLTTATCVRAVQAETVRARLPSGDYPEKQYTVVERVMHPEYGSGNHTSDFALMVLNEDVTWELKNAGEACMEFKAPEGDCQVVGFSSDEELILTQVEVRDGPCRKRRGGGFGGEVACAEATEQCAAAAGAPVLCPTTKDEQGGRAVVGVARMHCVREKVLFGKIQPHVDWLTKELKKLGVDPVLYTP